MFAGRIRWSLFGIGIVLSLVSINVKAKDTQSLTILVKNVPRFANGELQSCSMYFSTIFMDNTLQGRTFFAEGTIGFFFEDRSPVFLPFTKVAVAERVEKNGKVTAVPVSVLNPVIAISRGITTKDFESFTIRNPENPYAFLTKYRMNDRGNKSTFFDITSSESLLLSFRLGENQKIYSIPVDLTLEGVIDGKKRPTRQARKDFAVCVLDLFRIARQKLAK